MAKFQNVGAVTISLNVENRIRIRCRIETCFKSAAKLGLITENPSETGLPLTNKITNVAKAKEIPEMQ